MSIANYTDLKAAIADYMHRTDLTSRVVDFITLAESKINQQAKVRAMEIEALLSMTSGSRFIPLPSDFSAPIEVWLETYPPRQKLTPLVPELMPVSSVNSGPPQYWCIDGSNLAFECQPNLAYSMTLRYRGKFTLSDAAPTNALLTKYPDLYLSACLLEAALWRRAWNDIQLWQDRYDRGIQSINANEGRSRAVAVLTTDLNTRGMDRSNILRGY